MDYKQLGAKYQDFGNFNYGFVGRSLGIPREVLLYGGGYAQQRSNGQPWSGILNSLLDIKNKGDNPGD